MTETHTAAPDPTKPVLGPVIGRSRRASSVAKVVQARAWMYAGTGATTNSQRVRRNQRGPGRQ